MSKKSINELINGLRSENAALVEINKQLRTEKSNAILANRIVELTNQRDLLYRAINNALYGEIIDNHCNRDDNGLTPFNETVYPKKVLMEAIAEISSKESLQ